MHSKVGHENRQHDNDRLRHLRAELHELKRFLQLEDQSRLSHRKLVVNEKHALASKTRMSVEDLHGELLFLMPWQLRTPFYSALTVACSKEELFLAPRTDIIQMPFVMSIVAAKQGITFAPSYLERISPTGVVFRTFRFLPQPARLMPLCLAYRSHDLSPVVKNFIRGAQATISEAKKAEQEV